MKKKPILMRRIINQRKNYKRELIGLMGVHPGAGTTFTSLLLAFYMGEELGRRTAVLECNNNQDYDLLQNSYEWTEENTNAFSFSNITFMKNVSENRIASILGLDYECFILDFGSHPVKSKEEFLKCNTKIIVGDRSEWNRHKLIRFMKTLPSIRGNETWIPLIPCADRRLLSGLQKELGRVFYTIPFEMDPMEPSKDTIKLFHMLLDK